jgi:hypothetical protein
MNKDEKITVEEHNRRIGNLIDAVCHYRNLAIVLGAKPEQMTCKYDRELCERGINPNEDMGGLGNNVTDSLLDLKDVWDDLAELEDKLAMARQVSGELCDKCGWAMKFPNEPCRCELVEENTVLLEANEGEPWAWQVLAKQRDEAYKRGAEAMREQCALLFDGGDGIAGLAKIHGYRDFIRSLPLPKDD